MALLAYPLTCAYLFGKAVLKRTVRKKLGDIRERMQEQARQQGTFGQARGIGREEDAYETVERDGLEIRIPRE